MKCGEGGESTWGRGLTICANVYLRMLTENVRWFLCDGGWGGLCFTVAMFIGECPPVFIVLVATWKTSPWNRSCYMMGKTG